MAEQRVELPTRRPRWLRTLGYGLGVAIWIGGAYGFLLISEASSSPAASSTSARADQAAADQLHVQGAVVTGALMMKLQPLGWDLHGEVRDDGHLHVMAVAPGVLDKVEAKEMALLMMQQYVARIPTGKFVHVTVNTPAGQTLARAADRAR